jgi:hypothetical protein
MPFSLPPSPQKTHINKVVLDVLKYSDIINISGVRIPARLLGVM